MLLRTLSLVMALAAPAVALVLPARAVDPGPKKLPNGTGDGYADFATDAFGAFTSSECGGGLNADGSTKPLGAAEFDPYNPVTNRPRGGLVCNTRIHIFSPDDAATPVRQIFAQSPLNWNTTNFYPDGSTLAPAIRAADLVSDEWRGPNGSVRTTRFYPHLFPGLQVDLDQRAACAALTQVYRFTNTGTTPIVFRLVQLSDTDLGFGSTFSNNWGRYIPSEPKTSYVYNNAKDVALSMRARVDFDTTWEGWRIKVQQTAAWDFMRHVMYWGFPTGSTAGHEILRCRNNPAATGCPTPSHLNKIFRAASNTGANQYYIYPDGGAALEIDNDTTGGSPSGPDGWSDTKFDVAQSLQALYVIPPGESREYRTVYEGLPGYCRLATDAGFDVVTAVASADACATSVTLDGSTSLVVGGGAATYTWYDAWGNAVASGVSATITVVGAGEHRFDLEVCNGDGVCDVDFVAVIVDDADGTCGDSDGDGVVDALDLDDDDDGLPDADEPGTDSDGDGVPDALDLDSDGDHVPDLIEGDDGDGDGETARELYDADGDGRVDHNGKVDVDGDGWDDRFEVDPPARPDFDGDGDPDVVDPDDDGDQIPTAWECPDGRPCPANLAGQPDYLDVGRFACNDTFVATAGTWLGAGGDTLGTWIADAQLLGGVARDAWTGHAYVIDQTGALRRVTPGAEATLGATGLGGSPGVVALAARPEGGMLVAAVAGASTTTFYDVSLADGHATALDTVDGVVGDVAFDPAGNRVYTRVLGAVNQLVKPGNVIVTLASPVFGLAVAADGAYLGLTLTSGNLRVNVIHPTTGAFTSLFEPTRAWRPAFTIVTPYDLTLCPPNFPPEPEPDVVVTPYEQAVTASPLANDVDRDGSLAPATLTHGPADVAGATIVAGGSGELVVTPPASFVGAFGFDYGISDDDGYPAAGHVTVLVAPDAADDAIDLTQCDAATSVDLATNDASHPGSTFTLDAGAPAWAGLAGSVLTVAPPHTVAGTFTLGYTNCYASELTTGPICDHGAITVTIAALPCCGIPSAELVEACDGADDDCDGQVDEYFDTDCPGPVFYAIVEDEGHQPVGTIRCTLSGGVADCDRDPESPGDLMVYPALLCPAYATTY